MTILNEYTEKVGASTAGQFAITLFAFLACMFLLCCISAFKEKDVENIVLALVLFMISAAIVIVLSYSICNRVTFTTYEVTLSDDYPASELLEKYEIVEQRGEILVIRDKSIKEDQNGKGKN